MGTDSFDVYISGDSYGELKLVEGTRVGCWKKESQGMKNGLETEMDIGEDEQENESLVLAKRKEVSCKTTFWETYTLLEDDKNLYPWCEEQ